MNHYISNKDSDIVILARHNACFYILGSMSVLTAVKLYIKKMIDNTGKGMKVFLLGKETLPIVSITYAQSELLKEEVYLFDRIDNNSREPMKNMRCIVFLRPTSHNVDLLIRELKNPRYGHYHVYFSNILEKEDIRKLADADEYESVKEIQEFYADYIPLLDHTYTLNLRQISRRGVSWEMPALKRSADTLISVLLSLKKFPVIRYSAKSKLAQGLADNTLNIMKEHSHLFEFRRSGNYTTQAQALSSLSLSYSPHSPSLSVTLYLFPSLSLSSPLSFSPSVSIYIL